MGYLIRRFGSNPVRREILQGLIDYRKLLLDGGFVSGFQWIDGSFIENAEVDRSRAPKDVDIVTLFRRPLRYQVDRAAWLKESKQIFATFFNRQTCLTKYKCDSFPIDLDQQPGGIISDVTYWFALFSHQKRTNTWKGVVQLSLLADAAEHSNELLLNQTERHSDA